MLSMFANVGFMFSYILFFFESEVRANFLSLERSKGKRDKLFSSSSFYLAECNNEKYARTERHVIF